MRGAFRALETAKLLPEADGVVSGNPWLALDSRASSRHHGRQHPFDIPPEYVDVNIYSQHQGQADYEAALKTVSALVDMDPAQSTPEGDQLEILAILVEKYETEHFPMAAPVRRGHACIRRPCPLRGRRLPSFRRA